METIDCDVLVVGAGPTGLTLAIQLLSRGVRTRIIDRDPGLPKLSRAIGIQPRTLETLDMMGLAGEILALGHRGLRTSLYVGGKRRVGIDMTCADTEHGFVLHLPQDRTEEVLRRRLVELGGQVEPGVELVDLTQDEDAVATTLRHTDDREERVVAAYVVGCDGAHSRVRRLLGVPFEGQPYPFDWLLVDAELAGVGSNEEVHVFWGPGGQPLGLIPIDGRLWRISAPVPGDRGGVPPTLAEIQAVVDQRGPGGIVVHDPQTLTCFRCQIRSTDAYRTGRVLLAGDAVHIHAPTGAQGMNLGINDAANLGWKLAFVATGRAPDALLDSYGAERGPAARDVLAATDAMVRFVVDVSPARRVLRRLTLLALRTPRMRRRLADRLGQLAIAYPDSPITRKERVPGLPVPGSRMPNVRLHDGRTLHEALRVGEHVRLGAEDGFRGQVLVRPDGYVAAVARPGRPLERGRAMGASIRPDRLVTTGPGD